MTGQGALFDDPDLERLFLGVMLTPVAARQAAKFERGSRESYGPRGDPIREDRLHITLVHVGDYHGLPRGVITDVLRASETVSWPAIDVVFDQAGSFSGKPGNHPYVLLGGAALDPLKAFRRVLWERLILEGVKPLSRVDFNPHITLGYGDNRVEAHEIAPVAWRVTDFVLIHSELNRSRYNELGRWALSA